jgi:undecaprenyl diphosphate synthase
VINLFRKKKAIVDDIEDIRPKPRHVAVVMDGNGRWANAKGLSRIAGHKKGVESVKLLIKGCLKHKIPHLSIFAFSSENWSRPQEEVSALMELLVNAFETQTEKLNEHGVRLRLIGDLSRFDPKIQELAKRSMQATEKNENLVLNVAINYGGRWDVLNACQTLAEKVKKGELEPGDINEQAISQHLSTADIPDPDLFIRTSGEYRISNFFLWQAAYTELFFVDILWPDFDENAFTQALLSYTKRERRFGRVLDDDKVESAEVESAEEAKTTKAS